MLSTCPRESHPPSRSTEGERARVLWVTVQGAIPVGGLCGLARRAGEVAITNFSLVGENEDAPARADHGVGELVRSPSVCRARRLPLNPGSTEGERARGCGWVLRCSWDNGLCGLRYQPQGAIPVGGLCGWLALGEHDSTFASDPFRPCHEQCQPVFL